MADNLINNPGVGGTNTQGLAGWAGDYITNYLGKAKALGNEPYQVYQGPLTAGASPLQTQAFNTASNLTVPTGIGDAANTAANIAQKAQNLSYQPTTTSFGFEQAQQYMNPYLQASLDPQIAEAKRQAQIMAQTNAAKMTQGGAFGGGRSAIMEAEGQRNLGTRLADITGKGLDTAYTNAMAQFNADQARKMNEAQFGATYANTGLNTALSAAQAQGALSNTQNQAGLANLAQMLAAGNVQRNIEQEGITADVDEFNKQRQFPYEQVKYMRDMISGLPVSSVTNTTPTNSFTDMAQNVTTMSTMLKALGLMK